MVYFSLLGRIKNGISENENINASFPLDSVFQTEEFAILAGANMLLDGNITIRDIIFF